MQVKDYTISLNSVKNCATAAYSKGNTTFSFSSGYDTAGLGCTGDVCSSFGNIVGTAKDVCNCGSKTCSNGYTLNEDTCNCDCLLGCNQGGTCFAPYGGGSTRACSSGCGTESSASTCNGAVWSGTCWSPTQTLATSQGCGNSGTQTRTCTANCSGGSCGAWGACTGQTCPASSKPTTSEACGNCGTRTRSVTCNTNTGGWETGSWGTCSGQGVCAVGATQSCGVGGTQTCTSSCAWGSCTGQDCPAASKPTDSEACGNCNTGTRTRLVGCNTSTYVWTTGEWSACSGGGVCEAGKTQTCNTTGTQTCSSSCTWGTCSVQPCSEATKPTASQACGNCGTGTQTRTVTCNTATGTWTSSAWTTCSGGGACSPGATQSCGNCSTGSQTCDSSCSWGSCSGATGCTPGATNTGGCPAGYTGYQIKTCNSSCQWYVSTNNCTPTCTNTYTVANSPSYMSTSAATAADTCEANPSHQYVCQGTARQCVDAVIISAGSYTQKGTWSISSGTSATVPSGSCQYSTTNSVGNDLSWYTTATAITTCAQECYAIGVGGYGIPCTTSCTIVKTGGSYWSGWQTVYEYYKFALSCTREETDPYVLKYNVTCCGS